MNILIVLLINIREDAIKWRILGVALPSGVAKSYFYNGKSFLNFNRVMDTLYECFEKHAERFLCRDKHWTGKLLFSLHSPSPVHQTNILYHKQQGISISSVRYPGQRGYITEELYELKAL